MSSGGGDDREAGQGGRARSLAGRVGRLYLEVLRAYRRWWTRIIPLAALIFVPVAVIDRLLERAVDSYGPEHSGHAAEAAGLLVAMLANLTTSLLGEVLLAGMIALTLASSRAGVTPSIRQIARHLKYGRLILLDLIYALVIIVGMILLIVPGIAAFLLLSLSGPVVELEHRRIMAAFRRSARLVSSDLWLVFWVLVPLELFTGLVDRLIERASVALFGHDSIAVKLAETVPEILLSPLFAVAAVLLTLKLVARSDDRLASAEEPVLAN